MAGLQSSVVASARASLHGVPGSPYLHKAWRRKQKTKQCTLKYYWSTTGVLVVLQITMKHIVWMVNFVVECLDIIPRYVVRPLYEADAGPNRRQALSRGDNISVIPPTMFSPWNSFGYWTLNQYYYYFSHY